MKLFTSIENILNEKYSTSVDKQDHPNVQQH